MFSCSCLELLGATRWDFHSCEGARKRQGQVEDKKSGIATIVLGVCSRDMKFIFVLPGWVGSTSDSRVLRDAISRPNGLRVPRGKL